MTDVGELVERLRAIEETLRDLAYDRLRAGVEDKDAAAVREERRLLSARRAVERAITILSDGNDRG
jgi:hypothetical protein